LSINTKPLPFSGRGFEIIVD